MYHSIVCFNRMLQQLIVMIITEKKPLKQYFYYTEDLV